MKVGLITMSLSENDGWGRYSVELIKNLKPHVDIKVATTSTEEKFDGIEARPLLTVEWGNPFKMLFSAFKIITYLKDCDIIHCLVEPYAPVVAIANTFIRKPLIISGVGSYAVLPLDTNKKFLWEYAYKNADEIICISKFTQKEILKRLPLENTSVINLGVDYRKFQENSPINLNHSDKSDSHKIILSVGALKPRKGYDSAIRAFAEVKKYFKPIKYYIAGNIPSEKYYNELKELLNELNLNNDVYFIGKVSDEELIELYQKADIFLLTPKTIKNQFEGFGLVYLEANACGKPIIGSYDCGAEDIIINGYNGLLVPQNNLKKIADAIIHLLENPKVADKMGKNGTIRAKEMSWDNIVKSIIQKYSNLLN